MIRLALACSLFFYCVGPAMAGDDPASPQGQEKSSAGKSAKVPEVEQAEKGRTPDEKTAKDGTGKDRVFELRTYHTNEGKLEALNKRFRDHTCKLFEKHGMELIGFWTPREEKDGKGDTLVYLLAFPSKEAAEKSWKAFNADPEWKKVRDESHKNGVLVKKVESVYLNPTDYSAIK